MLREAGSKRVLVREAYAESVSAALLAGTGCEPAGNGGRGTLQRFAYEDGHGLVRTYLRGGMVAHVLRDAYVLVNRPLRELRVHAHVHAAGLAVPEPLGACWERRGMLVRGAFSAKVIPAKHLQDYLTTDAGDDEVLRRCGAVIRQMHDLGVWHADLQVRNILVGDGEVYLIDFDNARLRGGVSPLQRARNLFRLRRSFEKNGLPLGQFNVIEEGYGPEKPAAWVGRVYGLKGKLSDALSERGHGGIR